MLTMKANRLRVIAGPNGSGKSTLFSVLKNALPMGYWVNADEILYTFNLKGFIDFVMLGFLPTKKEFDHFASLKNSQLFIHTFKIENEVQNFAFGKFSVAFPIRNYQTLLLLSSLILSDIV